MTSTRCSAATSSPRSVIAGVAGIGFELVRLFQVELEHYEKIEGHALSLEGKANRLATMVRGNIGGAMQGLVVVPLFAGYDEDTAAGRIFSYDVAGGRYEEHRFHAIGSGSVFARGALKKLYRDNMPAGETALALMQALYDAADDDSATGGPDVSRRIYPVIATITADGFERLSDEATGEYARAVIDGRMRPPTARPHRSACPADRRARCRGSPPSGSAPFRPAHSDEHSKGTPAVTMPFYVSPEQAMKDKADYARKAITRIRSGVVMTCDAGILFVAPNPSRALRKFSEIYDRIAFAAVGRYNEFENLRKAGVRYADMTGFQYDRQDVTARGLANWYAQLLGTIFTESPKPYEVEIVVAEVGKTEDDDQIYRITFDGSVADEHGFVVMGGQADQVAAVLKDKYSDGMTLSQAFTMAIQALAGPVKGEGEAGGPQRDHRRPARGGPAGPERGRTGRSAG